MPLECFTNNFLRNYYTLCHNKRWEDKQKNWSPIYWRVGEDRWEDRQRWIINFYQSHIRFSIELWVHKLQKVRSLGARALFQSDQQRVLTPNTVAPEASSAHYCSQRTKTFLSHCNGRAFAIHTHHKSVEVFSFLMRPPDLEPCSLCWWQSASLWPNRATYSFNTNELSACSVQCIELKIRQ